MEDFERRRQQQLADEYEPNKQFDEQLRWSTQKINSELTPTDRISLGRYKNKKLAFEQEQREQRAAEARERREQQLASPGQ